MLCNSPDDFSILKLLREEFGLDSLLDLSRMPALPAVYAATITPSQRSSVETLMIQAKSTCATVTTDDDDSEWDFCTTPQPQMLAINEPADSDAQTATDIGSLDRLFAAAHLFAGANAIRDVIAPTLHPLVDADKGSLPYSTSLREVVGQTIRELDPKAIVSRALAKLDPRQLFLIEHGIFTPVEARPTLAHLGVQMGLSRERVRQLKVVADDQFLAATSPALRLAASWFQTRIPRVVRRSTAQAIFGSIVEAGTHETTAQVTATMLWILGYELTDTWMVRACDAAAVEALCETIRGRCRQLHFLPTDEAFALCDGWLDLTVDGEAFVSQIVGLAQFRDGWIRSDSGRAKVEAAIAIIGRPATRAEIAELTDLPVGRVGAYCSALPEVVRTGKETWGFARWVEEPYEGVAIEIRKRIERGGGSVGVEQLLQEIPAKYGVSEASVLAYVFGTARFVASSGRVRLATNAEIDGTYYGDVDEIDEAVPLGSAGWGFRLTIDERYFRGYSAAIPCAVASAAGLKPGDSLIVPVVGTDIEVSLIWRIDNPNRTIDIGRLCPLLDHLNMKPGDEITISISPLAVQIFPDGHFYETPRELRTDWPIEIDDLVESLFSVRS